MVGKTFPTSKFYLETRNEMTFLPTMKYKFVTLFLITENEFWVRLVYEDTDKQTDWCATRHSYIFQCRNVDCHNCCSLLYLLFILFMKKESIFVFSFEFLLTRWWVTKSSVFFLRGGGGSSGGFLSIFPWIL